MTDYLISEELRDSIIGLLMLLQKNSEKQYHKYSGNYTNRLLLADNKELKLPYLSEIQTDLETLPEVIEEKEYDSKVEELLLIAKDLNFF